MLPYTWTKQRLVIMFMHEKVVSLVQISKIWSIAHPAPIHLPFLQQELLFPVFLDPSKPQSPQDHSANFSLPTCLQPVQSCLNDFLDTTESSKVHPDPSNCLSKTSAPPFFFSTTPFLWYILSSLRKIYEPPSQPVWVKHFNFHWKAEDIEKYWIIKGEKPLLLTLDLVNWNLWLILSCIQQTTASSSTSQCQCNLVPVFHLKHNLFKPRFYTHNLL